MINITNVETLSRSESEDKAVGRLAEIIALQSGIPADKANKIRMAASLHDIGKRHIPAAVLEKPGKLTPEEFRLMKAHTIIGAKMLKSLQGELGSMARECCLWHHEWHDGNGYWGKRMSELPFYVAYTAISDVFAALIFDRPYKQAWPPGEALKYIHGKSGTQFDPILVSLFLPLVENDARVPPLFPEVMGNG